MILGGDIYQMHTKKRDPYLKKEDRGMVPGPRDHCSSLEKIGGDIRCRDDQEKAYLDQIYQMQRTEAWFQGEHD
jgi:hypothetical protein